MLGLVFVSNISESAIGKALGMKQPKSIMSSQWLSRRLNAAIAKDIEPQFKKKKTFSPSTIGGYYGRCARYWWHAFDGAVFDDSPSVKSRRAMDSGTAAHESLQKAMESIPEIEDMELRIVNDDPPILGFADFIVNYKGNTIVGEIKTVGSTKFNSIKAMNSPVPAHVVQILIYMWVLNADEGVLLYEDRDTFDRKMFSVVKTPYNVRYMGEIIEWMRDVRAAWERDEKPKRCFTKESIECKFCPLSEVCWQDDEGVYDIGRLPVRD